MTTKTKAQGVIKEELGLTPIRDWHRARTEGVVFHFPSGRMARVRPVSISAFLKLAHVPDMLTGVVAKMLSGEINVTSMSLEEYAKALDIIDVFIKDCLVWPKVVDEITDPENQILIDDISDWDKQTLFTYVGQPASALESFRYKPEKPVANLVDGKGDQPNA